MGGIVKYFLGSSKASYTSLVHWNLSCFFSSLKKGAPLTSSREMNMLRVAIHPINFYTSWRFSGGAIFCYCHHLL
jgi:hypothetical protein